MLDTYEGVDHDFWVSGFKNWISFGYVLNGQFDVATKLLAEAHTVFERLDDYYFMTWTLWLQAMIATNTGRP